MRKTLFSFLILALISAVSSTAVMANPLHLVQAQDFAQAPPPPDPRVEIVRAFLGLSGGEFDRVLTLLRTRGESIDPLRAALIEQERRLERLLRERNPDPAAVGSAVITIRGTRSQIEAAEDTFRNGFVDILNGEQKRKLADLEKFIVEQSAAPAFLSLGLIEVNLGPEPQQTIRRALGLDFLR